MRGAGRMGIAARLRERFLRGRGGFLRAKDLQGEASGVPDNGVKEQTRNLMEEAGGAEEATCALREADGVVREKTRNLTETADGAEETGSALRGVDKGKTPALGETFEGREVRRATRRWEARPPKRCGSTTRRACGRICWSTGRYWNGWRQSFGRERRAATPRRCWGGARGL